MWSSYVVELCGRVMRSSMLWSRSRSRPSGLGLVTLVSGLEAIRDQLWFKAWQPARWINLCVKTFFTCLKLSECPCTLYSVHCAVCVLSTVCTVKMSKRVD